MASRKFLTEKELQDEADRIMNEEDDGTSSNSSDEIREMFPGSGSSYRASSVSDSSEQQKSSFDEVDEETADTTQIQNRLDAMANQDDDDWVNADSEPTVFDLEEPDGLKITTSPTSSAKDIFDMLDTSLFDKICEAQSLGDNNLPKHSSMQGWKSTSPGEFRRFIGLCTLMGNVNMPGIKHYWSTHVAYNHHIFGRVLNHISQNKRRIFYPGRNLSLDEALPLWRGRLLFRQYILNKKAKYGIKLYELGTPDGFVLEIYSAKGLLKMIKVMVKLVSLAQCLYKKKTHVVGTLRKARKGNPIIDVNTKSKKREKIFRKKGNVLVLKWKYKSDVLMISTLHSAAFGKRLNKRGLEKEKPLYIIDYNRNTSGVDRVIDEEACPIPITDMFTVDLSRSSLSQQDDVMKFDMDAESRSALQNLHKPPVHSEAPLDYFVYLSPQFAFVKLLAHLFCLRGESVSFSYYSHVTMYDVFVCVLCNQMRNK
nr:unnamed protein product [Callosobruchus analis]